MCCIFVVLKRYSMEQVLIIALVVVLIFGGLVVYSISGNEKE